MVSIRHKVTANAIANLVGWENLRPAIQVMQLTAAIVVAAAYEIPGTFEVPVGYLGCAKRYRADDLGLSTRRICRPIVLATADFVAVSVNRLGAPSDV